MNVPSEGDQLASLTIELQARFGDAEALEILLVVLRDLYPNRVAVVSSFGAESAVLLHLVATIDPATPILFVDTRRHFPETLAYRDRLAAHLGLRDVRNIGPSEEDAARLDVDASRATWDPDGCCAFRKTDPLRRCLQGFDAWISGRKRFQAATRQKLQLFELDGTRLKINPLANWSGADLANHIRAHNLPVHPLVAQGYPSIGCAPCTSVVRQGEEPRAGRWRGLGKVECGIHLPAA